MIAGLLLILPLLAFATWVICTVAKDALRSAPTRKPVPFLVLTLIGLSIAVWITFYLTYKPNANFRLSGFPVPTTIARLEQKEWIIHHPPSLIYYLGFVADFLFGVAVGLLPLKIVFMFSKLKQELSR